MTPPRERDRYMAITVPFGSEMIAWADQRIREGNWRAFERLAAVVGERLVRDLLEAARVRAGDAGGRETDPGDEPPDDAAQ